MDSKNIYRWCDSSGGGIVIAASEEEARKKLTEKFKGWPPYPRDKFMIWPWENDDYYDEANPDVMDIYGEY